jgi:hypothetical protein
MDVAFQVLYNLSPCMPATVDPVVSRTVQISATHNVLFGVIHLFGVPTLPHPERDRFQGEEILLNKGTLTSKVDSPILFHIDVEALLVRLHLM